MDDLIGAEVESAEAEATEPAREDQPYVGLALRWRPRRFDDLVGQAHISDTLKNAIAQGRIAQAYLFCGPRGVGKTSTARILARALNCVEGPTPEPCGKCNFCRSISAGSDMDVVEIDGASNNKVDDVRELREHVNFTPFAGRYKIYIIDEVHMLSTGAFNALLKTLEEPPERVKFIFATTEPHKVPATIKSRCQVSVFGHISEADMAARLKQIVASEPTISVVAEEESAVLDTIAHYAEGSMRDALVALDQVAVLGGGQVSIKDVQGLLGLVESDKCIDILEGICARKTADLLRIVDELVKGGRDLERIIRQLVRLVRDALILKAGGPSELVTRGESEQRRLNEIVASTSLAQMVNISQVLVALEEQMRKGLPVRFALELAIIKLTALAGASDIGELMKKLESAARQKGAAGGTGRASASSPAAGTSAPTRMARDAGPQPPGREMADLMQESQTEEVEPPTVVRTSVHLPPDPAGPVANDVDPVDVSDAGEAFNGSLGEGEALPAGLTGAAPPRADEVTPRIASIADPKVWLRETLDKDPSLAELVQTIKEVFSAREVALDGIPLI